MRGLVCDNAAYSLTIQISPFTLPMKVQGWALVAYSQRTVKQSSAFSSDSTA